MGKRQRATHYALLFFVLSMWEQWNYTAAFTVSFSLVEAVRCAMRS